MIDRTQSHKKYSFPLSTLTLLRQLIYYNFIIIDTVLIFNKTNVEH